jgi:DNA-binding MarR family transcriptional regulator
MLHIGIDEYVFDVLMPDLVGHDHSPSAFLVYLFLWSELYRSEQKKIPVSLRGIAEATGLSKSAVQAAMRILKRRRLVAVSRRSPTATPEYELLRHWIRRRLR